MHAHVQAGLLLAATLLLWPLLANVDYIYFYDTSAYLRYPAQAFRILFGIATVGAAGVSPSRWCRHGR